uniref:Mediator of RNA polymerase II transcription subunit 17 n=1 Tax=Ascaris suum TaxID=6253 RepID=F1KYR9_ASCSU
MYGCSQSTSAQPAGVNIAVEAGHEWQIQEIGFDGVEKYIRPPTYSDHVAKMAHRVDWRKLVGADASYDNPNALPREDDEESSEEVEKPKLEMEDRKVPDAGPWHTVAKNLHEALQQINVLVDTLAVLKMPYLEALTVMDSFEMHHNMQDVVQQSKQFQWVTKRKSLLEVISVLEHASKLRLKSDVEVESDKEMFFRELKKMREQWRVRKTGNVVYGDLGYRIFGSKYNPSELFDITRRSLPTSNDGNTAPQEGSALQVQVPCDLIRRSTIAVSIEIDDMDSKDLFAMAENDLDYMRVEREKATEVHWSLALQWAQESLICRDIFNQLSKEAVLLKEHIAMVRDGVLVVSLFDNVLLRVELSLHPFEEGELPVKGDEYLGRSLRQLFVSEQCTRWVRHQMFIAMPLTSLPESLDLRGPYAMSANEIECRNKPKRLLLERLMSIAAHYVLTNKVTSSLERYLLRVSDPQVTWNWLRSTSAISAVIVTASNRNYDYIGKTTFYIRIEGDEFYVMTKEGQRIDCRRDEEMLTYTIEYLICNYMLNTVTMVANKLWQWQVLHANVNAIDEDAEPSPTLYICNQSATRAIFMQFHMKAPPTIRIRKCCPEKPLVGEEADSFILLNYDRLIGTSLCRKIDNLCAMLKS